MEKNGTPKKSHKSRHALVVEGGGMRGVFSAGVLSAFGRNSFDPFDFYIGVSAGACNLASHLAGQNERNIHIINCWSSTKKFISYARFIRGGHLMDLDWLWDVTISEYRLDLAHLFTKLRKKGKEFFIAVTSLKTGKALYLKPDENTLEHYLKVSSAVPVFYRGKLEVMGEQAVDGGVADPIPVRKAHRLGADIITVIRSRPAAYAKKGEEGGLIYPLVFRKNPAFLQSLKNRSRNYMESVEFIKNPPKGVKVIELSPPPDPGVSRTTRNLKKLNRAYDKGLEAGFDYIKKITNGGSK